jgi:7-cyano-7-deazaguanine reductase
MNKGPNNLAQSPLGRKQSYISTYSPDLLFPIPRAEKRDEIGITFSLPFKGVDIWTAFELSWLNMKGKPCVAIAEFHIPCESSHIIESKSFKLYLNSFNQTSFDSVEQVKAILTKDLSEKTNSTVKVLIHSLRTFKNAVIENFDGECLDDLNITCNIYHAHPDYLNSASNNDVSEVLYSDLLKSNCLVTGQPDWGSVQINYTGPKIDREGLLKYIVSFRNHNEFHEQCVERMFVDILNRCHCKTLTVYARYTRRGGLDINPIRSTNAITPISNQRLARQ